MGTYEDLYDRLRNDSEALQEAVRDAVSIDRTNLSEECFRQSSVHMTWGYMSALAQAEAASLEFEANEKILPRLRLSAKVGGTNGKVTDQAAKDMAASSPEYQEAYEAYLVAQARADLLKKVEYSLIDKGEMLKILTYRERNERQQ